MSLQSMPSRSHLVSLHIANLHCPSCLETIFRLLSPLQTVQNISASLLLSTVTFSIANSEPASSSDAIVAKATREVYDVLTYEGGFEVEQPGGKECIRSPIDTSRRSWIDRFAWARLVKTENKKEKRIKERRLRHLQNCDACRRDQAVIDAGGIPVVSQHDPGASTDTIDLNGRVSNTLFSISGMTCASCTGSITSSLSSHPSIFKTEINLLSSSGTIRHRSTMPPSEIAALIEDAGFEVELVRSEVEPEVSHTKSADARWNSVYMITGMTCASCSSAINNALRNRGGVLNVSIDVLGNKGIIVHSNEISSSAIREIIEDVGYDTELISSEAVIPPTSRKAQVKDDMQRSIAVRVDGVFCREQVMRINSHLSTLPVISYTPLEMANHTTTIVYRPHAPLSIRSILSSISGLEPELEADVVRTQTISDRSRIIQKTEFKLLLFHLGIAFVFAIPTFIIAIVAMTLLPEHNAFRMYWMSPIIGATSRATYALLTLATIVQFGVGRLFYQRALNSFWPHLRLLIPAALRPTSLRRLPPRPLTWQTFFNFGSMDLLVVLSTTVSYCASIAMLILDAKASPGAESVGTYFDSCVFLIMFILLGRTLESYAKSRTTDAVSLLGSLRPETALLLENSAFDSGIALEKDDPKPVDSDNSTSTINQDRDSTQTALISVDLLEIGDVLLIQPGSLPPTDGVIISGSTTFDESSLTGESKPISKKEGDDVFTGTTNLLGAITVRVSSLTHDTMLERIIRAVCDASVKKAPIERLAEKLTGVFVPVIVYLAMVVLVIWLSLAYTNKVPSAVDVDTKQGGKVFFAIEFAISWLVVACPCGIGLAVPCAIAVGNGIAAAAGILASGGGEAYLAATKITRVVFDKTGTLTVGQSKVTDEAVFGDIQEDSSRRAIFLAIKQIEEQSSHPLAAGLVAHLSSGVQESSTALEIIDSAEIGGKGVSATVKTGVTAFDVIIGNVALMQSQGISLSPEQNTLFNTWAFEAKSVVLVGVRGFSHPASFTLFSMFSLSDPPRPTAPHVIAQMKKAGFGVTMLSGDNVFTAKAVGAMVGIAAEDVRGGAGPEAKAEAIRLMQAKFVPSTRWQKARRMLGLKEKENREIIMFVGDGINDTVALAAADVSVAMGHGSQATLASADFVLLNSSLETLMPLLLISRKVYNRQIFNLFWALSFNVVCLPFAAGAFYALGGIRLTPVWSAVLMALSSVSVVLSSLALRWGL